jgi:hypothetical protein
MTEPEYKAWFAEGVLRMYSLKAGHPSRITPPGQDDARVILVRQDMITEAFALADAFVEACAARGVKPWEGDRIF